MSSLGAPMRVIVSHGGFLPESQSRQEAFKELFERHGSAAIDALLSVTKSTNSRFQQARIDEIIDFIGADAADPLGVLLEHQEQEIRFAAARSLYTLGTRSISQIARLEKSLHDVDPRVCDWALSAFASFGAEGVPPVMRYVAQADTSLPSRVRSIRAPFGWHHDCKAHFACVADNFEGWSDKNRALLAFEEQFVNQLLAGLKSFAYSYVTRCAQVLAWLKGSSRNSWSRKWNSGRWDHVFRARDISAKLRLEAESANAAERAANLEAYAFCVNRNDSGSGHDEWILDYCRDPDPNVRRQAVFVLERALLEGAGREGDTSKIIHRLQQMLRHERDIPLRRALVQALTSLGSHSYRDAGKIILRTLRGDPCPNVREEILKLVRALSDEEALSILEIALRDLHPGVRAAAVRASSILPNERARIQLGHLSDPAWMVRHACVVAWKDLSDLDFVDEHSLYAALDDMKRALQDPHWRVRQVAVHVLARKYGSSPGFTAKLQECLKDKNSAVRIAASRFFSPAT